MFKDIGKYFSSSYGSRENSYTDNQSVDTCRSKYLEMTLDEKRTFYMCGHSYVVLEEIPLWPVIYKVNEPRIKKAIRRRQESVQRTFKYKEDNDIPKKPLSVMDELNVKISLWQGDITKLEIGAIVNAANESLLGGGGVDGSIHRAAGPTLVKECRTLNGCMTGEAKLTSGHKLPAKYVIHTVGPRGKKPSKLEECYKNCLKVVLDKEIKSVAFCCISTGVFGYPNRDAAHVALLTTRKWLEKHGEKIERIIFCTFLSQDFEIYQELMADKYFPCKSNDTVQPVEDPLHNQNEEKVPLETDESVVAKAENLPSESDDIPPEKNIPIETDDLSCTHENSEEPENKKKGIETDDLTVVDTEVKRVETEELTAVDTECKRIESDDIDIDAEKDGISNGNASESIEINESNSQDAMDLGSQQTEQDVMDLGSQSPIQE